MQRKAGKEQDHAICTLSHSRRGNATKGRERTRLFAHCHTHAVPTQPDVSASGMAARLAAVSSVSGRIARHDSCLHQCQQCSFCCAPLRSAAPPSHFGWRFDRDRREGVSRLTASSVATAAVSARPRPLRSSPSGGGSRPWSGRRLPCLCTQPTPVLFSKSALSISYY